ncbi:MAG: hypothetical protein EHM45_22715, partial [Desulfobacteraceae bacterium]
MKPFECLNNDAPILITGCHRSGTTFVGDVLSHSRNVAPIIEPFNLDGGIKGVKYAFPYIGLDRHQNENNGQIALVDDLFRFKAKYGFVRHATDGCLKVFL